MAVYFVTDFERPGWHSRWRLVRRSIAREVRTDGFGPVPLPFRHRRRHW